MNSRTQAIFIILYSPSACTFKTPHKYSYLFLFSNHFSILQQKSHGVPSWCEQLLHSMLYDGLLSVVPVSAETRGQKMIRPPDKYKIRKIKGVPISTQASSVNQVKGYVLLMFNVMI